MCQYSCNVLPITFLHCKNPACDCVLRLEIKANLLLSCLLNVIQQLSNGHFAFLSCCFSKFLLRFSSASSIWETHRIKHACPKKWESQRITLILDKLPFIVLLIIHTILERLNRFLMGISVMWNMLWPVATHPII